MTRYMLDDLFPNRIPLDTPVTTLIGTYLGHAGNPDAYEQAAARFPRHQIVTIASHNAVDAQVLDVERGAVEPTDYATTRAWLGRQLDRDVFPTIYCNTSTWPTMPVDIRSACNWWAANWSNGPVIPPGAVGVQYGSVGASDISILHDYIEGIDPMTQPLDTGGTFNAVWTLPMPPHNPPASDSGARMFDYFADIWNMVHRLEAAVAALTPNVTPPAAPVHYTGTVALSPVQPT